MEYVPSSSPDPLSNSTTYHSPKKVRRSNISNRTFPLNGSSPTKQTFELDVGNISSPQRLIVTVEADTNGISYAPRSATGSSSPSRRALKTRERTTTTTVPLKGLSDSEDDAQSATTPKRARGRPRKSNGTPVQAKSDRKVSRNGTPSRKRRSIGDLIDGDDEADVDYRIGRNVEVGRGKGKSRSRSTKSVSRKPAVTTDDEGSMSSTKFGGQQSDPSSSDVSGKYSPLAKETLNDAAPNKDGQPSKRPLPDNPYIYQHTGRQDISPSEAASSTTIASGSLTSPSVVQEQSPLDSQVEYENDLDEDDELGDLQEFDTILESEEFSMISVDSVPSLRQHYSSPLHEQEHLSALPEQNLRNKATPTEEYNDSFSEDPGSILAAATPARIRQEDLPISTTDRISSARLPPKTLEAATPQWKSHLTKFKGTVPDLDDSFSSVAPEILEAATPARYISHRSLSIDSQRPVSAPLSNGSTRLLTPDETPSPGEECAGQSAYAKEDPSYHECDGVSASRVQEPEIQEAFMMHSYMPSSPPVPLKEIRANRSANAQKQPVHTPYTAFSSPRLPPPKLVAEPQETANSTLDDRPVLLTAARAGHALQQSIMIPSSPRSRSNSLGSPFKSPAVARRPSVTYPYLPSPSQERTLHDTISLSEKPNSTKISMDQYQQQKCGIDPTKMSDAVQVFVSTPETSNQITGPRTKTKITNSRFSSVRSADISIASGSAMSWQPEAEISIPVEIPPGTPSLDIAKALQQKWDRERVAVSSKIESADSAQVIVLGSDTSSAEHTEDDDVDDEGLQLLLETINSSSPIKPIQEQNDESVERPKRGKIPSPWRQNSKRLIYSDELNQPPAPVNEPPIAFPKSYIAQHREQPVTRLQQEETPILSDDSQDIDLSGFQIPQKSNFKPRPRESSNLNFAALLSPLKPLPTLPREHTVKEERSRKTEMQSTFAPILQKTGFNPSPRKLSNPGFFHVPVQTPSATPSFQDASTPLPSAHTVLTLKHPHALNRAIVKNLDASCSPSSGEESISGAVRSETVSHEQENTPVHQKSRTLKWTQDLHLATKIVQTPLPNKLVSPTKSCFRTPSVGLSHNVHQSPSKNVVFVSSSPEAPSPSPEQILSATVWSKKHWLLLDSFLLAHQPAKEGEDVVTEEKRRRRNSTRVISKLLGRKVTSQGVEMRFEQWHLEAVDEFREQVPGWEEKVIAMRAFALLVGAERRGLTGRS